MDDVVQLLMDSYLTGNTTGNEEGHTSHGELEVQAENCKAV